MRRWLRPQSRPHPRSQPARYPWLQGRSKACRKRQTRCHTGLVHTAGGCRSRHRISRPAQCLVRAIFGGPTRPAQNRVHTPGVGVGAGVGSGPQLSSHLPAFTITRPQSAENSPVLPRGTFMPTAILSLLVLYATAGGPSVQRATAVASEARVTPLRFWAVSSFTPAING